MKQARAAIFIKPKVPFDVRTFDVALTPSGYGRSELIASGVCGTDIHIHNGTLDQGTPSIIGHEFIGRLVDLDEEEGKKYGFKVGDNVLSYIAVSCGECVLCKSGDDSNCVNMTETTSGSIEEAPYLWGAYTQVNYTPLKNLVKVPDALDPVMVSVLACAGPTGMHAFSLAERGGVKFSDIHTAVVQGMGPVGIFALMYLKSVGVEHVHVVCGSYNEKREEFARALGADEVFSLSTTPAEKITEKLMELTDGLGVDLVFEASGAPIAVAQGMDMLRNRGVYLIPGQYSNSGGITIQPQMITFKALHIIGSSQYSFADIDSYLDFLIKNPDLHSTIRSMGTFYSIDKVNEAFDDARAGRNIKTVLIP